MHAKSNRSFHIQFVTSKVLTFSIYRISLNVLGKPMDQGKDDDENSCGYKVIGPLCVLIDSRESHRVVTHCILIEL